MSDLHQLIRHNNRSKSQELFLDGCSGKKLVAACRNGDKSAYADLVRAYAGCTFAICMAMVGNRHDAEDLAQQAMLQVFRDMDRLRSDGHFGAWLGKTARNLCIDFLRRRKYTEKALLKRASAEQSNSREYPELEDALVKLPQRHRIVLMLYYFGERNAKDISETLGISEAAVYTRMSRARKQLRKLLSAAGGS